MFSASLLTSFLSPPLFYNISFFVSITLAQISISKSKTVDGFTLIYYCTDVYGSKLFFDDTNNYTSIYTYTNKVGPGRSTYPGKVSLDLYGSGIKRVYVAISKIHTTDGKTYNVPESELSYYYWELD